MFFFGSKDTYSSFDIAKKTKEKASADHSYDKPAAEEKLLKKIPSVKDDNKLFYYAVIDRPAVRNAAIDALTDPKAIQMAAHMNEDNYDTLRHCVDNPNIAESDIRWIMHRTAGFAAAESLLRHIITEKLHSEKDLLEAAEAMVIEEQRLLAISRLNQKESLRRLVAQFTGQPAKAAADRYRELYPETAGQDLCEVVKQLLTAGKYRAAYELRDGLQLSDQENQDLEKEILSAISNDTRLQPKKEKNGIGLNGNPQAAMSTYEFAPVAWLLETITPGKALYSFVKKWKTSSVLPEKEFAADQKVLEIVVPKLSREQLLDLISKNSEKCLVAARFAVQKLAKEEDGLQIILDAYNRMREKASEDKQKLRNFLWDINDDRALAFLLDHAPDDAAEKKSIAERILWISRSEDLIVRCLTEYDMNSASSIRKLSEEGRKTLALSARNARVRSEAAKTLQDTGHVRILRNRCSYCGAEVTSELILAGTIEAHYFYKCTGCGRTEHETILGPQELRQDIYIYDPEGGDTPE